MGFLHATPDKNHESRLQARIANGQPLDMPRLHAADCYLVQVMLDLGPAVSNGMGIQARPPETWAAWAGTGEINTGFDVRALTLMSQAYTAGLRNTHPLAMSPVDLASPLTSE